MSRRRAHLQVRGRAEESPRYFVVTFSRLLSARGLKRAENNIKEGMYARCDGAPKGALFYGSTALWNKSIFP
jgi:hypothetical protein